jgi:uncharacterized protein
MGAESVHLEVVYAAPEQQWTLTLEMPLGTTVRSALKQAGIDKRLSVSELALVSFGIFGVPCGPDTVLGDGDRIEIYRPLVDDPKLIRRRRDLRARRQPSAR